MTIVISHYKDQKMAIENLINLINRVDSEAEHIVIEMYETMNHVQRFANALDEDIIVVSSSKSSDEEFNNSDNSLPISLTDTFAAAAAIDPPPFFSSNLSTPVNPLAMSSTGTVDILSENVSWNRRYDS